MRNLEKNQIILKMKRIKSEMTDIYSLEDMYRPSDDIFNDDDFQYDKLKRIIFYKLDDTERRIILCYAHIGNIRDTAKIFHVSTSTLWGYIYKIKKKIKNMNK